VDTELDTGILDIVHLELELEDEVRIACLGGKEGIDIGVVLAGAYDAAILDYILGASADLLPTFKVLSIEKRCPILGRRACA
jgi:hypothetical protein